MEEDLINLVRTYPVLYNSKLAQYKDSFKRNSAWIEIANAMKLSVDDVKIKWNKLRNSFTNALKRRHNKTIQGSKALPPWRYEAEMAFLMPFMETRDSTVNYQPSSPTLDIEIGSALSNHSFDSNSTFTPKQVASGSKTTWNNESDDLFETTELRPSEKITLTNDLDETDLLFLSMSRTLKKLPKIEQCRMKLDFFKAVQEAELRQLERDQSLKISRSLNKNNKFIFCSTNKSKKRSKVRQKTREVEGLEAQEEQDSFRTNCTLDVKIDHEECDE